jgi:DNA integrity scanning protein DisA with diadenylate cyclase activity
VGRARGKCKREMQEEAENQQKTTRRRLEDGWKTAAKRQEGRKIGHAHNKRQQDAL